MPKDTDSKNSTTPLPKFTYQVKGMHCPSCEILIENKITKLKGVVSVKALTAKGQVTIEYLDQRPAVEELNNIFKDDHYSFFENKEGAEDLTKKKGFFKTSALAVLIIAIFIFLNKFGLTTWINVNSRSSLISFFLFGIIAGLSTCAALVGGLVLAMSKQWLSLYQEKDTFWHKLQPHLMFNTGRLISYGVLGAVLGGIGSRLKLSLTFSSILVMLVSVLMIILALQMLGVKGLKKFQITLPKSLTKKVSDESKFQGRYMPFLLGALTFFLPCGFTITAQGLALLSGNILQGGLIMLFFALGTTPVLIAIGLSSVKLASKPQIASNFLKIAGILVLFFALFNINSQLNVLGYPSISSVLPKSVASANQKDDQDLPSLINGKQIIQMDASANGYNPNYFKVRVDTPVRWEITDTGTSGCTNAVISNGLFNGQIDLTPGKTSIKEFTPTKTGKYKFSCWMGMITGTIEVVDKNGSATIDTNISSTPSGAAGCGCGGNK